MAPDLNYDIAPPTPEDRAIFRRFPGMLFEEVQGKPHYADAIRMALGCREKRELIRRLNHELALSHLNQAR